MIPGYLGTIISSSFKLKIKYRSVGMLYKMKNLGCDDKILLSLYFSLFQSHLSYGLVAWGSSSYAKNIYLIQKKLFEPYLGSILVTLQQIHLKSLKFLI